MQGGVQGLRGLEIPAEGLLQDDPRVTRAARASAPLDDRAEQAQWNREIVERPRRTGELLVQGAVDALIGVVPVDVDQPGRERLEGGLVDTAPVLLDALVGARSKLLERPARARHRDDRYVE